MNGPKIVNVACSNDACTKPLFAFEIKPGKKLREMTSYGASLSWSPPRLGVHRKAWAICPDCRTRTEIDIALLEGR